jgi:hypothetical protein
VKPWVAKRYKALQEAGSHCWRQLIETDGSSSSSSSSSAGSSSSLIFDGAAFCGSVTRRLIAGAAGGCGVKQVAA